MARSIVRVIGAFVILVTTGCIIAAPQDPGIPPPAPPVVSENPPRFIFSPALGFYVSVDTPYDMIYDNGEYYLYNGGYWYGASSYYGPWGFVGETRLPPEVRRFRHEDIRRHRDTEYRAYLNDREHYGGRWHEPERRREGHEHRGWR